MKLFLLLIFLFASFFSFSQTSDFMVLRRGDKTIQTFFPGSYINFQLDDSQWLEGKIIKILKDSIFIDQQKTQRGITYWGTQTIETINLGLLKYGINEIIALPAKQKGFSIINDGSLFILSGSAYIGLNIINSIIQKDAFFAAQNLSNVGTAALGVLFGKVLQWSHPVQYKIGKKYQLQIIHLTDNK